MADSESDTFDDDLMKFVILSLPEIFTFDKISYHNSILTGNAYVLELMETPNEQRFVDVVLSLIHI